MLLLAGDCQAKNEVQTKPGSIPQEFISFVGSSSSQESESWGFRPFCYYAEVVIEMILDRSERPRLETGQWHNRRRWDMWFAGLEAVLAF